MYTDLIAEINAQLFSIIAIGTAVLLLDVAIFAIKRVAKSI